MNPPARAMVFSFDEKTQVHALDRTQPSLPLKRGRGSTMTRDYKRHQYFDDSRQRGTRRDGVAAHVGLHALGSFADRIGLSASLPSRIEPTGERQPLHDRGKVLVQMALVLAGGGEICSDIEHLRVQDTLFGSVPSDTTVFRTFHELIWKRRIARVSDLGRARQLQKSDARAPRQQSTVLVAALRRHADSQAHWHDS
jgi:hypothetical protein